MPASLSIESRLQTGLRERSMSTTEFARVAELDGISGASRAQLDRAFRDDKPLRGDVAEKLWNLWQEVEHLQFWLYVATAGTPIKIDFSDGAKVHEWLQTLRERMKQELEKNSSGSSTALADNHTAEEQAEIR